MPDKIVFRTCAGVLNGDYVSADVGLDCSKDEVQTVQSDLAASDINNIVRGLLSGSENVPVNRIPAQYYDASFANSFEKALDIIDEAEETFAALPSNVRANFNNSTQDFLAFVSNPDNVAKFPEYGLVADTLGSSVTPSPEPLEAPVGASQGADAPVEKGGV